MEASVEAEEVPLVAVEDGPRSSTRSIICTVLASGFGNLLEWYDFALFGIFAEEIGASFFDAESKFAATMFAFGIFGGAFVARPIGGVVLGHVADRHGRLVALRLTIVGMAVPTAAVAVLPATQR